MRAKFWGVRGGLAAPGAETADVGGNTSCIEVRLGTGALIVLDAGIGLYWLGRGLLAGPHGRGQGETAIFLTRTHLDHIQGIPFFVPAFLPGNKVFVYGGGTAAGEPARALSLREILEGQMREVYSPIVSLTNMPSLASIVDVTGGRAIEVAGGTVTPLVISNGDDAPTVAYRIEEEGRALVYATDVQYPATGPGQAIVDFARGADVLIHEAYYTEDERRGGTRCPTSRHELDGRMHATFGDATELALRAGARRLYYTHHHPDRDDASVQRAVEAERARVSERGANLEVDTAREGVEISV